MVGLFQYSLKFSLVRIIGMMWQIFARKINFSQHSDMETMPKSKVKRRYKLHFRIELNWKAIYIR